MKLNSIIGISRGDEFSPNHVDNDAAIYNKVVQCLQQLSYRVECFTEKEFVAKHISADVIFDMARDRKTINRLKELEKQGSLVINSAFGIDNCVRKAMTEQLIKNGIPHPKSSIISTDSTSIDSWIKQWTGNAVWIKRGDSHAMVKQDVCYVDSPENAYRVLKDFNERSIPTAVINEHLKGDLIKFYGIQDSSFFYWFYPAPCSHSKFGLEIINGEPKGFPFSEEALTTYCKQASCTLNVPIYGGDCIVNEKGDIQIIDFNDWPSFARCREEAGESIAVYIDKCVRHKINK
ncbi:MAG: hypothetical protein RR319_00575 [Bacteroides sp.]